MSLSTCGLAVFACVAVLALQCAVDSTDALPTTDLSLQSSTPLSLSSRDIEDEVLGTSALTTTSTGVVVGDYAVKDTALGKYKLTVTPIRIHYMRSRCGTRTANDATVPVPTYCYLHMQCNHTYTNIFTSIL